MSHKVVTGKPRYLTLSNLFVVYCCVNESSRYKIQE